MTHTNDMLLWQKVFQVAKKLGGGGLKIWCS